MAEKRPLSKSLVETLPASAEIAAAISSLLKQIEALEKEAGRAVKKGSIVSAKAFVVLHRLRDKFEQLNKAYSALFERYKVQVLPELFDREGVTSLPLTEGFRVGISYATRASIREGKRDEAFNWMRTNGFADLISSTVNSSTLSAAARHAMDQDNIDFPSDLFNVAQVANTSVTVTK